MVDMVAWQQSVPRLVVCRRGCPFVLHLCDLRQVLLLSLLVLSLSLPRTVRSVFLLLMWLVHVHVLLLAVVI